MSKRFLIVSLVIIFCVVAAYLYLLVRKENFLSLVYGVSFDPEYAGYLKLDPQKVYRTILDDWRFRNIRLSARWDKLEKERGIFDFKELDWQMDEAAAARAKIVLAIGQKTPRWPECHLPAWAVKLPETEYRQALNKFIERTVERYKNHPALEIWQVENEPFLPFGVCPIFDKKMLLGELDLIKRIDPHHPTLVTDSGELSTWRRTARVADLFGTTMYRVVWNKNLGYLNYDWLPPSFYRAKLWLNQRAAGQAYITELQAEPWITNRPIEQMPMTEQYKSMNLTRLKKNLMYAGQTGFPRAYLWGAEWWYWLKERGVTAIPDFIATLNK